MGGGIESVAGKGTGNPRVLVLNYSHFPPPPPPPHFRLWGSLAMSGNIVDCHPWGWGTPGIYWHLISEQDSIHNNELSGSKSQ